MDIHFEHNGVSFIWNYKKAMLNQNKHDGIIFEQATQAFLTPSLNWLMQVETTKREMLSLGMID